MSAKINLYRAVKAAVERVPEIRNVLKYNSQDEAYENERQRNMPIAYIYFPSIEWEENKLGNLSRTNEQDGIVTIAVRLNCNLLQDTDLNFENVLEIADKVYNEISLIKAAGFNSLVRVSEQDFIDNTNVRVWETVYTARIMEAGLVNKEKLTQVSLDIVVD